MTKVMKKEARHTQRRDRASGVPLEILEHLMKAQHEGALTPACIVQKNPQVPQTFRQVACHPVNNSKGPLELMKEFKII